MNFGQYDENCTEIKTFQVTNQTIMLCTLTSLKSYVLHFHTFFMKNYILKRIHSRQNIWLYSWTANIKFMILFPSNLLRFFSFKRSFSLLNFIICTKSRSASCLQYKWTKAANSQTEDTWTWEYLIFLLEKELEWFIVKVVLNYFLKNNDCINLFSTNFK